MPFLVGLAAFFGFIWWLTGGTGVSILDNNELSLGTPDRLDATQIAELAQGAGFSGNDLVIAVAVALAESSGKVTAYNPETKAGTPEGRGSYGLWQIYRKAHPEFDNLDLFDPTSNAYAAYHVYRNAGNNFSPWSTFKNNAYLAHVQEATDGVNA